MARVQISYDFPVRYVKLPEGTKGFLSTLPDTKGHNMDR